MEIQRSWHVVLHFMMFYVLFSRLFFLNLKILKGYFDFDITYMSSF